MKTGHPKYGNCFTFNSILNKENDENIGKRKTALTGSSFGLFLTLKLQMAYYLGGGLTQEVRFVRSQLLF